MRSRAGSAPDHDPEAGHDGEGGDGHGHHGGDGHVLPAAQAVGGDPAEEGTRQRAEGVAAGVGKGDPGDGSDAVAPGPLGDLHEGGAAQARAPGQEEGDQHGADQIRAARGGGLGGDAAGRLLQAVEDLTDPFLEPEVAGHVAEPVGLLEAGGRFGRLVDEAVELPVQGRPGRRPPLRPRRRRC